MSDNIKLTPKQIKFCEHYIKGNSGKDSYLYAYDTKCNDATAYAEATRLLSRDDIQEYLKYLRKPLEEHAQQTAITERERIKGILWNRLQRAIEREDDTVIVKITDQINRMNAEYINVNRNIDETHDKLDDLDIDALKALVKPSDGV